MTESEFISNLKAFFPRNMKPDDKGLPETEGVLGTDRVRVIKKCYYCPNPAHVRWEEYYLVEIDGREYHMFWYSWREFPNIADVYPGRDFGRTVVHISDELVSELAEASRKSHRYRDCVNIGALKAFHREEYDKYFGNTERKEGADHV